MAEKIKASDLLPINRGDMVRGEFGSGKLVDVLYHADTVRLIVETSVVLDPDYELELNVNQRGRHMMQPKVNRRG